MKQTDNFLHGLTAVLTLTLISALATCGCATKQIAQNLQGKSLLGSGFVALNQITVVDPSTDSYTPQLKSLFVTGDLLDIKSGEEILHYRREQSTSVWNAQNVTTRETLVIQSKNLPQVVRELSNLRTK